MARCCRRKCTVIFFPPIALVFNFCCCRKAEESPSAIMLSHAGLLSARKGLKRRAAMLYAIAARKLEKCGIVSDSKKFCVLNVNSRSETSYVAFSSESANITHAGFEGKPIASVSRR